MKGKKGGGHDEKECGSAWRVRNEWKKVVQWYCCRTKVLLTDEDKRVLKGAKWRVKKEGVGFR